MNKWKYKYNFIYIYIYICIYLWLRDSFWGYVNIKIQFYVSLHWHHPSKRIGPKLLCIRSLSSNQWSPSLLVFMLDYEIEGPSIARNSCHVLATAEKSDTCFSLLLHSILICLIEELLCFTTTIFTSWQNR